MSRGYVIFAQKSNRKDFHRCAYALALSIKVNDKNAKITVIADSFPKEYTAIFENVILKPEISNPTMFAAENKWMIYEFSPYDETIVIDADVLILDNISNIWENFKNYELCFTSKIYDFKNSIVRNNPYRHFIEQNDILSIYQTVHYFKKTKFAKEFHEKLREVADNYQHYYEIYLKNVNHDFCSMDAIIGITAKLLKCENKIIREDNNVKLVHMKSLILGFENNSSWIDHVLIHFDEGKLKINNYEQSGFFHYVDDRFLTSDIIDWFKKKIYM